MKKVLVLGLLMLFINSIAKAEELTATACFYKGFEEAAKAYNAGDGSAFTHGYGGPSGEKLKTSPCCKEMMSGNTMSKPYLGYVAGYQAVYFHGPNKFSVGYAEKEQAVKIIDMGYLGF